MSRAPGINVMQGAGSATYLLKSPHCVGGGPPQVSRANVPFDLTKFDVSTLAGVEWYPDNDMAPIEFTHSSARCGLLLLWTRER